MTAPSIRLESVSKWYGNVLGLNGVSFDVLPGITGLIGPNGAGKSTLMKLITGQLRPSAGRLRVFGRSVWRSPGVRRRIGYAPADDTFYEEMTGRRFVYNMARLSGLSRREAKARSEGACRRVGMATEADKRLRACSKGMRQRIKLAQALVHDPELLVLDEPLTGVDPEGRRELLALFHGLRDEGRTLLVSSHILHELEEIGEQLVLMAQGRVLAAGTLGEIRALLDHYPLTVRLRCAKPRALAAALIERDLATGVGVLESGDHVGERTRPGADERGELLVKTRKPARFFTDLPEIVVGLDVEVHGFETVDDTVEAVFEYLVREMTLGGGAGP